MENITNPFINDLYFSTILMFLVMMIIYTLVFQILLHFQTNDQFSFSSKDQTNNTYQTPTSNSRSNSSSTLTKTEPCSLTTSVIDTTEPIKLSTYTSQVIPFYDPSYFKYKNFF